MEDDINKVIEVTESLRARSKGRYFENIAEICHESFGWDEVKTTAMLDRALRGKKIYTATVYNKLSYRKCENRTICIEDNSETTSTQTDMLSSEFIPKSEYERLQLDFEEFKRFTHGEIVSLKAELANRPKSPTPKFPNPPDKDREALLRSLQERIISLERQLQDKQNIILKLLDGPRVQRSEAICPRSTTMKPTPSGYEQQQPHCAIMNGEEITSNTGKANAIADQKKEEKNIHPSEEHENRPKQTTVKERKRITIVGDSMLNGIFDEGMQKHHNITIKRHPGATTRDIVDYVKPVIRKKPDCLIIHAGTNDLTNKEGVNTIENLRMIIKQTKQDSPDTTVVLSSVVIRRDKKVSVANLNKEIKQLAKELKIVLIDNANLDVSCLSRKKLHLNEKGNSYLASNFLNFIRKF